MAPRRTPRRTAVAAARRYIRLGWSPVPVPKGKKGPLIRRWQNLRLKADDVPKSFSDPINLGLLTGEASGGLIDVDLDCPEAVRLARNFLPDTKMWSGHTLRPRSHAWYIAAADHPKSRKFSDGKIALVELRSSGQQTLVAPSVHPDGDCYTWDGKLEPNKVGGRALTEAVERLAAACLLARHWPKTPGSRHDIANALAGMLLRGGWQPAETRRFVLRIAQAAGDEEAKKRAQAVTATAKRLEKEGTATGAPALARQLGDGVVDNVRDWLHLETGSPSVSDVDYKRESIPWPAPLDKAVFHGLAGEFVETVEPHTESDPAALLAQFLTAFGNLIGRDRGFVVEADHHYGNIFVCLVGDTSKGRKGTSWGHVRARGWAVDQDWAENRIQSGLSSGEGLIWSVRDPIVTQQPVKEGQLVVSYQDVIKDHGVDDKRLLVLETEFASLLRVLEREGNNLSAVVREAWDTGTLRSLTKNSPAKATGAHISIVGHITRIEVQRYLHSTEIGNGFANRFLWVCARRSKYLPDGGTLKAEDFGKFNERFLRAADFAKKTGLLKRDRQAVKIWHAVYRELSEGRPGLLGAVTSRAEAQVVRLSCLYALLDCSAVIKRAHLQAALAFWKYCDASARYIFGSALGDPVADEILRHLERTPNGATRTEIRDVFGRNRNKHAIGRALDLLVESDLAYHVSEESGGRPTERWFARSLAAR